jgi:hypothetical protein
MIALATDNKDKAKGGRVDNGVKNGDCVVRVSKESNKDPRLPEQINASGRSEAKVGKLYCTAR